MTYAPRHWRNFVRDLSSQLPIAGVRPVILESWMRSRAAGVDPASHSVLLRRVDQSDLARRLNANQGLLAAAEPVLRDFSKSLGRLQHAIYLADRDGIVLFSTGTNQVMIAYGLMPGYDWSEATMGTNGAGTALATGQPVAVPGPDHYQLPFHSATCLAAPLHSPNRQLVGAIDLSTSAVDADPDQLRAVIDVARQIESSLRRTVPHITNSAQGNTELQV